MEDPRRWAHAAGLYDLSKILLPEEVVEVRIWEFYRNRYQGAIVQKRSGSFLGAELSFGSIEPDNCAGWAVGLEPCVSWESAWLELLDLGLMDLPDSTELPGVRWVEDGVAYVVELQSQGKYRTYLYANPDYQTWPEARRIEKIIDVVGRRIRCDQYRPG